MKPTRLARISQLQTDQRGFTLHEVLVAIVISSLLVGFGLSLFLFAQKLMVAQERRSNLKMTVDRALITLSADVERSCQVSEISDSALVLRLPNRRLVRYRFGNGEISRNDDNIHGAETRISVTIKVLEPPVGSKAASLALGITIRGESAGLTFTAETIALAPWSARQEFLNTSYRTR